MKWLPVLCVACALLVAGTLWYRLDSGIEVEVPTGAPAAGPGASAVDPDRAALHAARRECSLAALDAFIAGQRQRTGAEERPAHWRLLGEALLERVLCRCQTYGMAVGAPLFPKLPDEVVADLDEAERAVRRAIELGDTAADSWRVLAGVLSNRITGLGTALRYNGEIEQALRTASERDPRNGRVHVALGLRKLLAPKFLGHDPAGALEHFEFACKVLPEDERPRVFAAMASFLQQKRMQAVEWLEQAVQINPRNVFARVVLQRLRRDEPEPFARSVSEAEVAAAGR